MGWIGWVVVGGERGLGGREGGGHWDQLPDDKVGTCLPRLDTDGKARLSKYMGQSRRGPRWWDWEREDEEGPTRRGQV